MVSGRFRTALLENKTVFEGQWREVPAAVLADSHLARAGLKQARYRVERQKGSSDAVVVTVEAKGEGSQVSLTENLSARSLIGSAAASQGTVTNVVGGVTVAMLFETGVEVTVRERQD